jgi:hypothetical protein
LVPSRYLANGGRLVADIFISYSRKDQNFVHRLADALEARDKDVWVDFQDIPPTSEWLKEIYAGIEEADNVVFSYQS